MYAYWQLLLLPFCSQRHVFCHSCTSLAYKISVSLQTAQFISFVLFQFYTLIIGLTNHYIRLQHNKLLQGWFGLAVWSILQWSFYSPTTVCVYIFHGSIYMYLRGWGNQMFVLFLHPSNTLITENIITIYFNTYNFAIIYYNLDVHTETLYSVVGVLPVGDGISTTFLFFVRDATSLFFIILVFPMFQFISLLFSIYVYLNTKYSNSMLKPVLLVIT